MKIEDFISTLIQLFPQSASTFSAKTVFKNCPEWNSLFALSIIAAVEEEFEILLKGNDLVESNTIQDLFDIVSKNKK